MSAHTEKKKNTETTSVQGQHQDETGRAGTDSQMMDRPSKTSGEDKHPDPTSDLHPVLHPDQPHGVRPSEGETSTNILGQPEGLTDFREKLMFSEVIPHSFQDVEQTDFLLTFYGQTGRKTSVKFLPAEHGTLTWSPAAPDLISFTSASDPTIFS